MIDDPSPTAGKRERRGRDTNQRGAARLGSLVFHSLSSVARADYGWKGGMQGSLCQELHHRCGGVNLVCSTRCTLCPSRSISPIAKHRGQLQQRQRGTWTQDGAGRGCRVGRGRAPDEHSSASASAKGRHSPSPFLQTPNVLLVQPSQGCATIGSAHR